VTIAAAINRSRRPIEALISSIDSRTTEPETTRPTPRGSQRDLSFVTIDYRSVGISQGVESTGKKQAQYNTSSRQEENKSIARGPRSVARLTDRQWHKTRQNARTERVPNQRSSTIDIQYQAPVTAREQGSNKLSTAGLIANNSNEVSRKIDNR
jgi:hypothetical protein